MRTNCPTVAEKPERKALKGYNSSKRQYDLVAPDIHTTEFSSKKFHCSFCHVFLNLGFLCRGVGKDIRSSPAKTQYANCRLPAMTRKAMKVSMSFVRCGVVFW